MKITAPETTLLLDDLIPAADLAEAVQAGLIRVQRHPSLPLRIFNYTESAVFARAWTPATRTCRGLIVADDGVVVARPWAKFFNHGESVAPGEQVPLDLEAAVEVTDKADGSLGILYRTAAGPGIATRGSFAGEQAVHASAVYLARYHDRWEPVDGWTYLFEIIYPANRIVLDYGARDDLVLLGAVRIATGEPVGPGHEVCAGWPGPRTAVLEHTTLAQALAASPRPNAEGVVVRHLDGPLAGNLVKVKQADYVALHRIVTGLTARRLWERAAVHAAMAGDATLTTRRVGQALRLDAGDVQGILDTGADWALTLKSSVPEEFWDWIEKTMADQAQQVEEILGAVRVAAAEVTGLERREIAGRIAGNPHRAMIFAALDGKPVHLQAWAAVRPPAERAFGARGEDVA